MSTRAVKRRPKAKRPKKAAERQREGKAKLPYPETAEMTARHVPGLAPPHTGRAVRGCACWLCVEHRRLDRQAARDHALAALHDDGASGAVRVGPTATQALRDALGAT